jgi:hypothetical protein
MKIKVIVNLPVNNRRLIGVHTSYKCAVPVIQNIQMIAKLFESNPKRTYPNNFEFADFPVYEFRISRAAGAATSSKRREIDYFYTDRIK